MNRTYARRRGFSLPELMVSLVIGLVLVLAITVIVARQEDIRRSVTSGNDLSSNSAYSAFVLDRELRHAGSGLVGSVNWGCPVAVSRNNAQLLPTLAPFPAPFAAIPATVPLAPVIAHASAGANGSDVLAVMAGNSGLSESGLPIAPMSATAGQVQLNNTIGMRGGDLILVTQAGACMLQQVSNGFAGGATPTLTFGGTYAADTIGSVSLTDFASSSSNGSAYVSVLGNTVGNRPRFQLLGIDSYNTLVTYDLLNLSTTAPQPLVEGVVELKVRYGIDGTGARTAVTTWVAPSAAGYTAADLSNGTSVAQTTLGNILAVRVGLVIRSDQAAKEAVTGDTITLFGDLGGALTHTYNVPAGTQQQRYRAVEFTIPLRNVRF